MTDRFQKLAPGVARLRLPMRFHPGHVNSYLLDGEDGWLVVDAGNHSKETRDAWRAFLDSEQGEKGLRGIFLTHGHPDHYGSAPWLARHTGVPVHMAEEEWDAVNRLWRGSVAREPQLRAFYRRWGADASAQDSVVAMMAGFCAGCPPLDPAPLLLAPDCRRLPGDRDWQLVPGFGHTPRNLMLWRERDGLLITGDQVLPSIVPNVSLWFDSDPDPLALYLETLVRIRELPVTRGLPAHGEPFDDFSPRCDAISAVHHKRLQRLREALADGPVGLDELARAALGKPPGGPLFMLVAGQLYALLRYLQGRGEVHCDAQQQLWMHHN